MCIRDRSCTRILLPLSLIVGFILILQGTPMGFDGKMKVTTMAASYTRLDVYKRQELAYALIRELIDLSTEGDYTLLDYIQMARLEMCIRDRSKAQQSIN